MVGWVVEAVNSSIGLCLRSVCPGDARLALNAIKACTAVGMGVSIVTGICIASADSERLVVCNMSNTLRNAAMREGGAPAQKRTLSSARPARTC